MLSSQKKLNTPPRVTNIVMLAIFVFQLGACPCGCLEHNSWLELLGLEPQEHVTTTTNTGVNSSNDDHECTGEGRPYYVSTARQIAPVSYMSLDGTASHTLHVDSNMLSESADSVCRSRCDHSLLLCSADAPALQIMRV